MKLLLDMSGDRLIAGLCRRQRSTRRVDQVHANGPGGQLYFGSKSH